MNDVERQRGRRELAGKPMGERISALESWVEGHEALCADRFGDLKQIVNRLVLGVYVVAFGVMGWLAIQLYTVQMARLPAPSQTSVQVGPAYTTTAPAAPR